MCRKQFGMKNIRQFRGLWGLRIVWYCFYTEVFETYVVFMTLSSNYNFDLPNTALFWIILVLEPQVTVWY